MLHSLNTFDVFDTLITRRSGDPASVLRKLEKRAGRAGLAEARLAADARLWATGKPYQLPEIWQEVRRTLGLSTDEVTRFCDLEIEIEHEESIPIVENLALVRDGDVLISDTYFPREVIRSLLKRAGLDREVALVVSNHGKFTGKIWSELLAKVRVREHFGDNLHSDGESPTRAGIRAVIYTGAGHSPTEKWLAEQGWEGLALLTREVRLANPFLPASARERCLWDLTCQLNFPLLVLGSHQLERHLRQEGLGAVLFVSRDCRLWHQLHRSLFPDRLSHYFYTSRACLFRPTENYLDYFRSLWRPDSLIVDLSSTGASWAKFFARLNTRGRCFFLARINDFAYTHDTPLPDDWLQISSVFKSSELGVPFTKCLEMINYATHPVVEDVVCLPNQEPLPRLDSALEFDAALPEAACRAFRSCLDRAHLYPRLFEFQNEDLTAPIGYLVRQLSIDRRLPVVYSGHQLADAAYERRVLDPNPVS